MLLRMTGGRGLTSLSFRAERGILFFVYLDSSVISFPQNDRVGAIRFFTSFRMKGEGGKILRSAQNDREEEKTSPLLSF